jgi:hypothetical protein
MTPHRTAALQGRSSRRYDPDGWIPIAVVAILPIIVGLFAILYESLLHWR